ncbi:MAG: DUF2829 domain-containing protein, partial [Clostridia bacterium]|nr:DUF2829 domain-containing protein [Clostridia bacterium]
MSASLDSALTGMAFPYLDPERGAAIGRSIIDNPIYAEKKPPKTYICENMDRGQALYWLKNGFRVCRAGWNGKGQYIELATNISYKNPRGEVVNANHSAIGNKAIAFVGTSGTQMGWLASQADLLAEDWMVVR